ADKHMEGVRLTRWLLSPVPTFLLWRRMKLWELRSYDQVIKLEQERLVYQARLRSRFGRAWRRKAPVESLMPLRLARYGVPLADTAPEGLAAAGIEVPVLLPAASGAVGVGGRGGADAVPAGEQRPELAPGPQNGQPEIPQQTVPASEPEINPWLQARDPQQIEYQGGYDPTYDPRYAAWLAQQQYQQYQQEQYLQEQQQYQQEQFSQERFAQDQQPLPEESPAETTGSFPIPSGPGRTRELGEGGGPPEPPAPSEEDYYLVFRESIKSGNGAPTPRGFIADVEATYGVALDEAESKRMVTRFSNRLNAELADEHIA
ncbi:DUF2637 domain-containing protein, partial [Streptomyces sp. NPDC058464]|uniref:DUF2637 domain-containing protein n=1 Tax=Streptomyces sp. NPDC058464 TaxID=3346511 RepID=UPI0036605A82